MFDELMRELRRLEGRQEVSVAIPTDAEGYIDRECPSSECLFQFKVHEDDWRDKVRDDAVFCPFCGHSADSGKWFTQDQIRHAEAVAVAKLGARLGNAIKRDARQWNQRQGRDGFLRITMQVNDRPQHVLLPPGAADPMRLKIACPECQCRYGVIGAAFFCPACGHNAADLMFGQSVAAIANALEALGLVRSAIPDCDTAETTVRLIVENGLQNAVTTFQRYAEALHARFPKAAKTRRNAFQNLVEGGEAWYSATGKRYGAYLDGEELNQLGRYFQQRHLLAHTQGLVDADYVAKTGDATYRVGQRVVIREPAVRRCLQLIEKLAAAMAADCTGGSGAL